jgi:hypothetical protein
LKFDSHGLLEKHHRVLLCLGAISWADSPRSADGADDPADKPPIAATAGDAGGVAIERGPEPANGGPSDRSPG